MEFRLNKPIVWSRNDALFRSLVGEGHAWQNLPFIFLKLSGFDVEMPELSIRDDISEAGAWLDTYDLRIGDWHIEVKSRPFTFTSPADWPRNRAPAFVDTKKKWDAKTIKPFAYIFVSKATGAMVATCGTEKASLRWGTRKTTDRVRNIRETFYTVDLKYLVTMNRLVASLRKEGFPSKSRDTTS